MVCDRCQKPLVDPYPKLNRRYGDEPQYKNALRIRVSGGYGMFIDPTPAAEPKAVICGECAEMFLAENTWIIPEKTSW